MLKNVAEEYNKLCPMQLDENTKIITTVSIGNKTLCYRLEIPNKPTIEEINLQIEKIKSMPGVNRYTIDKLPNVLDKAENFRIPIIAYQVSGEYSLLENGIQKGLINNDIVIESLIAFKRAGANAIVSYYADRLDKILKWSFETINKLWPR